MTPEEIHEKLKNAVIRIDDSIKDIDMDAPYIKAKMDEANETLKKYKLPDEYYEQIKKKK